MREDGFPFGFYIRKNNFDVVQPKKNGNYEVICLKFINFVTMHSCHFHRVASLKEGLNFFLNREQS